MNNRKIMLELESIHYRYERLTSLISIMQQFVDEVVEIAGAPAECIANALYEIELGMNENNDRLKEISQKKGGDSE